MVTVILTAAGIGTRMQQDIPKQFIHVEDKPIIIHTMEAFQKHPSIDSIIVVTLSSWIQVVNSYAKQFNINKLKWVIPGGNTGQESIKMAINKMIDENISKEEIVMIHDGNRCMVSSEIISDSLSTFNIHGSAVAGIPCVEAIFRIDNNNDFSIDSIPRENIIRTQTPHTYKLKDLIWAHNQANILGIKNTAATCTLMQQLGNKVYFSKGSEENLKITTIDDLKIFKALLKTKKVDWLK